VGLLTEHGDRALKAARAQGFGGAAASLARSCDHDVFDPRRQFMAFAP